MAPPYGPSMMMMACCCKDLTRYGHSEPQGRATAARGGRQNTEQFRVRAALPWAAALSGPWGTREEPERRDRSPQPSSWCHSSWRLFSGRSSCGARRLIGRCFRKPGIQSSSLFQYMQPVTRGRLLT